MSVTLSPIGKGCLITREGRQLKAYPDSVGVWTIGVGCTRIDGRAVRRGDVITSAECDVLFDATWPLYAAAVAKAAGGLDLADHEADALISFCYNIGVGTEIPRPGEKPGFLGSTVAKRLRAGQFTGIPAAMAMWNKPAEIIARRTAEASQFAKPYTTGLPRARSTDKSPIVVSPAAVSRATVLAGTPVVLHPAQAAPVIEPVHLPAAHPWLDAVGGWLDRVLAPVAAPDLAARG